MTVPTTRAAGSVQPSVGWIGTGRMGTAMVERLLKAGYQVTVWNRTASKARALEPMGADVAETPRDLQSHDVVCTMVSDGSALRDILVGEHGVLTAERRPHVIVDSSTVDMNIAAEMRLHAADLGVSLLAAPVSGNPAVVSAGRLSIAVSGSHAAFESVEPMLTAIGHRATYVGEGDTARLVKICHNLLLGTVAQSMAEITVLAEKAGVARQALWDFLNDSVMGSAFSRYKTPALVNLDFTPAFTSVLLQKDLDIGLAASRQWGAPLPLAAQVHQLVSTAIGRGHGDEDFAVLLQMQAEAAGLHLVPEATDIDDGLHTT